MLNNLMLQERVLEALAWEPGLDATRIGVAANEGVITLTGSVRSYSDRFTTERVVKRVAGVKGLANDLQVHLPNDFTRTDTDLATAAIRALEWDVDVPHDRVKVKVANGWVTLEGEVDWQFQRMAAERAVNHLTGVVGVTNLLMLKVRVTPGDLKHRIESAFKRHAELEANKIKVETKGSRVVLTGTVSRWADRDEAEEAVWAAPGVTAVEDRLAVAV